MATLKNVRKVSSFPEQAQRESTGIALLDGGGGQRHGLAALPPGKTRYPLYMRLGGPQGRSGRVRKISPPPGFVCRIIQPIASRCTDCAIMGQQVLNFKYHLECGYCRLSHSVR